MTRRSGSASRAASSPPSAAGAGAGSAVQRATPKPVTAASAMAPATVLRRRLSLVIIFYLRKLRQLARRLALRACWLDRGRSDRKSVVEGKSVSVRVDLGGRRIIKKKHRKQNSTHECKYKQMNE